ncbi:MAG: NAD(P)H-dependent oxidoreductase subunit E [Bacillota bacterium]
MTPEKQMPNTAGEDIERVVTTMAPEITTFDDAYVELDRIIERYSRERGQLIRILQEAQEIFGCLPEEVQAYIAGQLGLPVSEVNGVVTFYALFHTEPRGKFSINVCLGTACYVQGAQNLLSDFRHKLDLKDGDTTGDGLFTVKSTRCIGACGLAPVITINNDVHGKLGRKNVAALIRKYKKQAEVRTNDQEIGRPARDQDQVPPGH